MTDFGKWFAQFTGCASGPHDWQEQQRQLREFFPGDAIPSALMTELPALASDVAPHRIPSAPMMESTVPFHPLSYRLILRLSWPKLIEPLRIEDPLKRAFYETPALQRDEARPRSSAKSARRGMNMSESSEHPEISTQ